MPDERRLKVLFLAANPVNKKRPLRSGREFEALKERLAAAELPVRIDLVASWGANPEDLQRVLLKERPAVVHFSGHAEQDIGILLEGKSDGNTVSLGAKILTDVFRAVNALLGSERIRCVVLNACESEALAKALSDSVEVAVGMRCAIADDAAIAFALGFYDGLSLGGGKVKHAVDLGKNRIDLAAGALKAWEKTPQTLACFDPNLVVVHASKGIDLDRLVLGNGTTAAFPAPGHTSDREQFWHEVGQRIEQLLRKLKELDLAGASQEEMQAVEAELRRLERERRKGPQPQKGEELAQRYLLLEKLDSGGFGTVWRARDLKTRELVAVKVLHGHHSEHGERHARFCRGARAMKQLAHPNIVRIVDLDQQDRGHHFFVMEYVAGGTFARAVSSGTLPPEQRGRVLLEVGDALAFAHEGGYVHRDVTPDNILLDAGSGQARLTDFDLVHLPELTLFTEVGGKWIYAAPECQMGSAGKTDVRCDVFSLGMTAVFSFHGAPLPPTALMDRIPFIKALSCSREVKRVLARATEPDRDRRFATMKEFCTALREACAAPPARPPARPRKKASPRKPAAPIPEVDIPYSVWIAEDSLPGEIVNSIGMKFAKIPAGKFVMGSPQSEAERREDEGPQHEVEITKAFYLGVYPVTQAQWRAVMGSNPSWFSASGEGKDSVAGMDTDDFPVESVSWEDAQEFLERLSAQAKNQGKSWKYRLPSEAEWEYACRGGARSYQVFHFGDTLSSTQANFDGNYPYGGAPKGAYLERTSKVGTYPANGFGLCDMHGNVREWCLDWYDKDYYAKSPPCDPLGPAKGSLRVLRGGSWGGHGWDCRSAFRLWDSPGRRFQSFGFRVALVPPEQ